MVIHPGNQVFAKNVDIVSVCGISMSIYLNIEIWYGDKKTFFASKGCGKSPEHMEILIWLKSNSYVLLRVNQEKAGVWKAFFLGLVSTVNICKVPGFEC